MRIETVDAVAGRMDGGSSTPTVTPTTGENPNPPDNAPVTSTSGRTSRSASSKKTFTAPTLPSATSQEDYIKRIYAANEQNAIDKLTSAYDQNVMSNQREIEKLPGTYNQSANQAAAQDAINRQRFNEAAAASGLNSGAGSQAQLSMNNALASNISNIRKAQSDAQANLDFQRAQFEAEYKNAIQQAISQNDVQKAQALYDEARRVDESIVKTAVDQANMDFAVWKALYG